VDVLGGCKETTTKILHKLVDALSVSYIATFIETFCLPRKRKEEIIVNKNEALQNSNF
jgi:hypothetical protein